MKSKISKELAELVGVLLGDGSINIYKSKKYSTYYRVQITTHSDDVDYVDYICDLFNILFNIEPIVKKRKNENAVDILIFQKHIVKYFLNLGLKNSPKWNHALIPNNCMSKEFGKYVLRGYFDTDGSVVITNNNGSIYPRLEMKMMPSPMQEQFISLLKLYGFKFSSYDIGKGKIRIQMNGKKQLSKWKELIGFSNSKHEKKAEMF